MHRFRVHIGGRRQLRRAFCDAKSSWIPDVCHSSCLDVPDRASRKRLSRMLNPCVRNLIVQGKRDIGREDVEARG